MILYRPVGLAELRLIYESALTAFPPRLPEQPIFYPVLNAAYAAQIAREWNTKSPEAAGYVTQFEIEDSFGERYEPRRVGARDHMELWVPAEELAAFNRHIRPPIRVTDAFFGDAFTGVVPTDFMLAGKNAIEQFVALDQILAYNGMDFFCEVAANDVVVFLHYLFWAQRDFSAEGITSERRDRVLAAIHERWQDGLADRPLPSSAVRAA